MTDSCAKEHVRILEGHQESVRTTRVSDMNVVSDDTRSWFTNPRKGHRRWGGHCIRDGTTDVPGPLVVKELARLTRYTQLSYKQCCSGA
jgi:hypothetical protein